MDLWEYCEPDDLGECEIMEVDYVIGGNTIRITDLPEWVELGGNRVPGDAVLCVPVAVKPVPQPPPVPRPPPRVKMVGRKCPHGVEAVECAACNPCKRCAGSYAWTMKHIKNHKDSIRQSLIFKTAALKKFEDKQIDLWSAEMNRWINPKPGESVSCEHYSLKFECKFCNPCHLCADSYKISPANTSKHQLSGTHIKLAVAKIIDQERNEFMRKFSLSGGPM